MVTLYTTHRELTPQARVNPGGTDVPPFGVIHFSMDVELTFHDPAELRDLANAAAQLAADLTEAQAGGA